jgi:hypothetical protein
LLLVGCGCGKEDEPAILYSGGESTEGMFVSTPAGASWLQFPGGRAYEFEHGLDGAPATVLLYLSFTANASGGNFVVGTGNAATVRRADDERIEIFNDTCTDYYVRVVATLEPSDPALSVATPPEFDDVDDVCLHRRGLTP